MCTGNPLADSLTSQLWPTVFGQASDAVVPRSSQVANLSGTEVMGVIHSAGLYRLNFVGPGELEQPSNIPAQLIRLLNMSSAAPDFHGLP
jgi:hypothetical protein